MLTLHVTNGDVAASGLARSGLPGDVLTWRDVLHDGPVPSDADRATFHRTRAMFIASRGWAVEDEVVVDFEQRDARLDGMGPEHEVTLWFEPDLYDQLQLMQILARLAARAPADRPRLTIVPADLLLGPLVPDKFPPLFAARRPILEVDLQHGADAWHAYTAASPDRLMDVTDRFDREVLARTYGASDDVRLPYMAASLRRALEEYPDSDLGLSRSERQICEALAPGEVPLSKLYRTAHECAESWQWLGDSSFAWYVERLSDCAQPLVVHGNGTRVLAPQRGRDSRSFWERSVKLTPFGQDVVRARADAVKANGIDRWIGGVHLTTGDQWRFEGRAAKVVRVS
ncbi:MAG: DUF1835 domain-containing protein [Gemmatimonadota bacterium]